MRIQRTVFLAAGALAAALGMMQPAAGQKEDQAEVLLRAGLKKELVDGDLNAAIEQYKKIVSSYSGNRAVAAKALLAMGQCYEKLGQAEARKIYERIVREYADQKEPAALARARLGGSGAAGETGIVARQVWTGPEVYIYGSVSPDGRYLSFVDQQTQGLALHDLANGTDRRLTNHVPNELAADPVISPDGKQVAYSWRNRDGRAGLRLIGLHGTGPATAQVLYDNEDLNVIVPQNWSPDGKWIAVQLRRKDETTQIGLVSATARSLRVLKSVDWRASTSVFFSPDGKYLAFDFPSSQEDSEHRDVFVLAADGSREIPAMVHAANDVVMGWTPDGKHLLFASDRTGAMGLWALPFRDGKPQGAAELVKSDIGRPRSLGITRSGALYFGVKIEGSDVYTTSVDFNSGKVLTPPLRQELAGFDAKQPDWSPDGKYLVYLTSRDPLRYQDALTVRSVETGQTRELRPNLAAFTWPRWAPDGRSFAVQGRDIKGRQGIYRVDAQTAEVSLLVQSLPGDGSLTPQWAPDGKRIFYRRIENLYNDGVRDSAAKKGVIIERDLASGKEHELWRGNDTTLGLSVAPDGRYVAFHTSNPATHAEERPAAKESMLLAVAVAGGQPRELVRVQAPQALTGNFKAWTRDSRSIIFQKTLSATGVDPVHEYWLVPLAGGQSRKVDLGTSGGLFRVHPDGSQVVFTRGADKFEVWVMENFLPTLSSKK